MTRTHCLVPILVFVALLSASALRCTPLAAQESPTATSNEAQNVEPQDPDDPRHAGHFRARVTDDDGQPVNGARLFIVPYDSQYMGSEIRETGPLRAETGADGRFEFDAADMTRPDIDNLPARRNGLLIVTAPGHGPDWARVHSRAEWRSAPKLRNQFALRLAKDEVPIRGQLLGPDNRPLAGAMVRLTRIMIPQKHDLDAHLEREAKASSRIGFLSGSGPSYERELTRPDLVPGLTIETRTDADGQFMLRGIGNDRLAVLKASAPGVVDTNITVITRDVPDTPVRFVDAPESTSIGLIHGANFVRKLEKGLTVTGRVIDRETHAPIPGMWVGPLFYYGMNSELYPYVSDKDGRFTISGLHPQIEQMVLLAFAGPGQLYRPGGVNVKWNAEAVIECSRGIPFRIKVTDEDGKPVEAVVTYVEVLPNPHYVRPIPDQLHLTWPNNPAARRADGSYEGFVIPGPGAIIVQTPGRAVYTPARVNPKAFFAPERSDWTPDELRNAYGTTETLNANGISVEQRDCAAIVLLNPAPGSGPLELSVSLKKDKPRRLTLVDPDGQPVVGVQTKGPAGDPRLSELPLRAATVELRGLHPERQRRIKFLKEDRKLTAFLLAQGDGDTPYTVRMEPWAAVTGRLVAEDGAPLPIASPVSDWKAPPNMWFDIQGEPEGGDRRYLDPSGVDNAGRFRIDQLVPGQPYWAKAYPKPYGENITVFENLVLKPGEVRDLGDIPTKLSYLPEYRQPTADDAEITKNVPADVWGDTVNGLRVAIVPRAPPVDAELKLQYDIVAENVSDHDIRFGAGQHYEYGCSKLVLVDAHGMAAARQEGGWPNWADSLRATRIWLKPNERAVVSHCGEQLIQLDNAGQPMPLSKPPLYFHVVHTHPGRYMAAAVVELGSGMTCLKPTAGPTKVVFAAKGEWTGTLRTGAVPVTLFDAAGK